MTPKTHPPLLYADTGLPGIPLTLLLVAAMVVLLGLVPLSLGWVVAWRCGGGV